VTTDVPRDEHERHARRASLIPEPDELVPRNGAPDTIAGWQALSDGLLSDPCCAFHRNVEISSRYAWIYQLQPACFKWAAMAAIASHHVRLALFPFRLDTDRTGYVDIPHSLGRRKLLLTEDVNTIRATNNAIFSDIFWVHLAYVTAEDGIERLRALLRAERHYAPVLAGFEAMDQGRRILADQMASAQARQTAADLIWHGNVGLLEHEQRALVQPNFNRLSCAFARLISIGAATSFEVRGVQREVAYFTSFYLYALTRGIPHALRAQEWPRITRLDDRWGWLVTSVVPRFRRLDADTSLVNASLRHIFDEARDFASAPCVLPRLPCGLARTPRPPTGQARDAGQQHGAQEDQVDHPGRGGPGEPVREPEQRDDLERRKQDVPDRGGPQAARVPLPDRVPRRHAQADQPGASRLGEQRGELPGPHRRGGAGGGEQRQAHAEQDGRLGRQDSQQPGRQRG